MDAPRLLNTSQRLTVIGRTGTGKTVAGIYQLARRDLRKEKWILLNFKGDEFIDSIQKAKHIDYSWEPGKQNGLFILHPMPDERKDLDNFLWNIWENGNTGIFADEGFLTTGSDAFESLLTQGRSKRIPVITCTQRPVWVSRFVFSESDFFQVFDLNDRRDWSTVESFMPRISDIPLPKYHSWYFDVGEKKLNEFSPVPEPNQILGMIDSQLFTRVI